MSRKLLSLVVLVAIIAVAAGMYSPATAQEKRWDGADKLPVNPLKSDRSHVVL